MAANHRLLDEPPPNPHHDHRGPDGLNMSGGTEGPKVQRRPAAILAADVVCFSSLMGQDEEGTLARIKSLRREVIEPKVREHHGRVFKTTGDGVLVEFASPIKAVRCAVATWKPWHFKPLRSYIRPSRSASRSILVTS